MKSFNHIAIAQNLNLNFGLTSYSQGNFIHFRKDSCEIGFIERIPKSKHFYTIYSSFFDFENLASNEQITKKIQELYTEQKKLFTKEIDVCLANANNVFQIFI
jgi:hypothetical protein